LTIDYLTLVTLADLFVKWEPQLFSLLAPSVPDENEDENAEKEA